MSITSRMLSPDLKDKQRQITATSPASSSITYYITYWVAWKHSKYFCKNYHLFPKSITNVFVRPKEAEFEKREKPGSRCLQVHSCRSYTLPRAKTGLRCRRRLSLHVTVSLTKSYRKVDADMWICAVYTILWLPTSLWYIYDNLFY